MKYLLAAVTCMAEFVACVLIAYLLGGGEQNRYIMYACAGAGLSAMGYTWRKITKAKKTIGK